MSGEAQQTNEIAGGTTNLVRRLAVVGSAGILLFWFVVLVLGLVRPEYSAVSDVISDLGAVNAPYGIVQQANFILLGLSVIAFVIGVDKQFRDGWRPWAGVLLIGVFSIFAAFGSGVFPVNNANPDAMTNTLHSIGVLVGFLAALVGIPLTAWRLAADERWPAYHSWKAVVGIAVLGFAGFALLISGMNTSWPGLAQRVFVGIVTGLILYHSFKLYELSGREGQIQEA